MWLRDPPGPDPGADQGVVSGLRLPTRCHRPAPDPPCTAPRPPRPPRPPPPPLHQAGPHRFRPRPRHPAPARMGTRAAPRPSRWGPAPPRARPGGDPVQPRAHPDGDPVQPRARPEEGSRLPPVRPAARSPPGGPPRTARPAGPERAGGWPVLGAVPKSRRDQFSGPHTFPTEKPPVINSGKCPATVRASDRQPNGVREPDAAEPDKTGCFAPSSCAPGGSGETFRLAPAAAPTCGYPLAKARRSTSAQSLSSPEICPDLRKRHSERAVSVLPWIATEGVPVT
ncbi:hypothetical protein A4G23_02479 [Streptomyces rubrolavendulae]|uniref:Uncharacterized protein n=1 Tax=Streptomyces rubrolavendulae TaxID=285473 RepID=A0A1D8G2H3_9ACTN|nr:hypothetical protein A4G23_02479 [Streptomyces rubrolavendulae]